MARTKLKTQNERQVKDLKGPLVAGYLISPSPFYFSSQDMGKVSPYSSEPAVYINSYGQMAKNSNLMSNKYLPKMTAVILRSSYHVDDCSSVWFQSAV